MGKLLLSICIFFTVISVLFWGLVVFGFVSNMENLQVFFQVIHEQKNTKNIEDNKSYKEHNTDTLKKTQFQKDNPVKNPIKLDPNNPNEWFREIKDGATSSFIPQDQTMSTSDELFTAMNNYRASHGLSILQLNGRLCEVAQKRAVEADANFSHEGFEKYVNEQEEFSIMAEVLHTGGKLSGVHIVEYGWDRSLTGHKETMRDPRWTHGCGGIFNTTAVFIFGKHF